MNAIQQWWLSLVKREQLVVAMLAVVAFVFILQAMIFTPLYQGRENARNSVEKQSEILQWMQQRGQLAKTLKRSAVTIPANGQSISQRISSAAQRSKIEINRFQTSGDNSVQVWLDNVEFSKHLLWLEVLHKQGIQLESISISKTSKEGMVSVRLTLIM